MEALPFSSGRRLRVDKVDINIDIIVCCSCAHNCANALCSATATANDTTKIARTYSDFKKNFVALARTRRHGDSVGVINDAAHYVRQHCCCDRGFQCVRVELSHGITWTLMR